MDSDELNMLINKFMGRDEPEVKVMSHDELKMTLNKIISYSEYEEKKEVIKKEYKLSNGDNFLRRLGIVHDEHMPDYDICCNYCSNFYGHSDLEYKDGIFICEKERCKKEHVEWMKEETLCEICKDKYLKNKDINVFIAEGKIYKKLYVYDDKRKRYYRNNGGYDSAFCNKCAKFKKEDIKYQTILNKIDRLEKENNRLKTENYNLRSNNNSNVRELESKISRVEKQIQQERLDRNYKIRCEQEEKQEEYRMKKVHESNSKFLDESWKYHYCKDYED